jgi:hypothetical protein
MATAAKSNLLCAPPLLAIINIKGLLNSAKGYFAGLACYVNNRIHHKNHSFIFSEKNECLFSQFDLYMN